MRPAHAPLPGTMDRELPLVPIRNEAGQEAGDRLSRARSHHMGNRPTSAYKVTGAALQVSCKGRAALELSFNRGVSKSDRSHVVL
ncbi:hypothetical protein GCM10022384_60480 [Streptomyces marokkonensis]|uniref:Uncharacterized protein n=1 Tax=Streptomyces marokkonensis TaxID=324855 RepID=A0ABP7S386_9ACTN